MPPQGSPTPGAAELTQVPRRRSSPVSTPRPRKKNNPGTLRAAPPEPHRIRERGARSARRHRRRRAICCRAMAATSDSTTLRRRCTTSPLLLERYLTAGLRITELAVGDAGAEPGTATYTISTVVTQNQHVEGLAARHARRHCSSIITFPADGEYVFSGRLLKTVAEGLRRGRRPRDAASVHRHHRWQAGLLGTDRRQGGSRASRREQRRWRAKSSTSA